MHENAYASQSEESRTHESRSQGPMHAHSSLDLESLLVTRPPLIAPLSTSDSNILQVSEVSEARSRLHVDLAEHQEVNREGVCGGGDMASTACRVAEHRFDTHIQHDCDTHIHRDCDTRIRRDWDTRTRHVRQDFGVHAHTHMHTRHDRDTPPELHTSAEATHTQPETQLPTTHGDTHAHAHAHTHTNPGGTLAEPLLDHAHRTHTHTHTHTHTQTHTHTHTHTHTLHTCGCASS